MGPSIKTCPMKMQPTLLASLHPSFFLFLNGSHFFHVAVCVQRLTLHLYLNIGEPGVVPQSQFRRRRLVGGSFFFFFYSLPLTLLPALLLALSLLLTLFLPALHILTLLYALPSRISRNIPRNQYHCQDPHENHLSLFLKESP